MTFYDNVVDVIKNFSLELLCHRCAVWCVRETFLDSFSYFD